MLSCGVLRCPVLSCGVLRYLDRPVEATLRLEANSNIFLYPMVNIKAVITYMNTFIHIYSQKADRIRPIHNTMNTIILYYTILYYNTIL